MVKKVEGPWGKAVGSTFFKRLGWSSCGHFIATTHGFQNPSHRAPLLERGESMASFQFVSHNAPVVAVQFNHSIFRKVNIDILVVTITRMTFLRISKLVNQDRYDVEGLVVLHHGWYFL